MPNKQNRQFYFSPIFAVNTRRYMSLLAVSQTVHGNGKSYSITYSYTRDRNYHTSVSFCVKLSHIKTTLHISQSKHCEVKNYKITLSIQFRDTPKYKKKAYHHNHHQTWQQSFKNNTFRGNDIHIVTQLNKTTTKQIARTYMIIHCISHMHPPT